jgi:hypothetical protein
MSLPARTVADPEAQRNFDVLAQFWFHGTGSPEGLIVARVGALYSREDGGAGSTLYVKESGVGATGWAAK